MENPELHFKLASVNFKIKLVEFEQTIKSYRENKLLDKFKVDIDFLKDDFADWKNAELIYLSWKNKTERKNYFIEKTFELENDYLNHLDEANKLILEAESCYDSTDDSTLGLFLKLEYYKSILNSQRYLPKFRLPRFNGRKEDWLKFSNLFKHYFLDNKTLKDERRLLYLKALIDKEKAPSIEKYTNSIDAWEYLDKHYTDLLSQK